MAPPNACGSERRLQGRMDRQELFDELGIHAGRRLRQAVLQWRICHLRPRAIRQRLGQTENLVEDITGARAGPPAASAPPSSSFTPPAAAMRKQGIDPRLATPPQVRVQNRARQTCAARKLSLSQATVSAGSRQQALRRTYRNVSGNDYIVFANSVTGLQPHQPPRSCCRCVPDRPGWTRRQPAASAAARPCRGR